MYNLRMDGEGLPRDGWLRLATAVVRVTVDDDERERWQEWARERLQHASRAPTTRRMGHMEPVVMLGDNAPHSTKWYRRRRRGADVGETGEV